MKKVWTDRRVFIALVSIMCLTFLGIYGRMEVAGAIATVVMSVAGSNAAEGIFSKRKEKDLEGSRNGVTPNA